MKYKELSPALLVGCKPGKNTDMDMKAYINVDIKTLANINEDYNMKDRSSKFNLKGIDTSYSKLMGIINVLNIYTGDKKVDFTINYSSEVKTGSIRVILVKSNNETIDIVKNSGNGNISIKAAGRSVIKCIADDATGDLKIDVNFDESLLSMEFEEDGIFLFTTNFKINGDNLTCNLYRVKVVNKKVDKMAKVTIDAKLMGDKYVGQFDDDLWGNAGIIEFSPLINGRISIAINDRKSKSPVWGLEEGTFYDTDEPLPSYLKGL